MKTQQGKRKRATGKPPGPHPHASDDQLRSYGDDRLIAKELDEIRDHISTCEHCSDRFLKLTHSLSRKGTTMRRGFSRRKLAMLPRIDSGSGEQPLDRPFLLRPRTTPMAVLHLVNRLGLLEPVA